MQKEIIKILKKRLGVVVIVLSFIMILSYSQIDEERIYGSPGDVKIQNVGLNSVIIIFIIFLFVVMAGIIVYMIKEYRNSYRDVINLDDARVEVSSI